MFPLDEFLLSNTSSEHQYLTSTVQLFDFLQGLQFADDIYQMTHSRKSLANLNWHISVKSQSEHTEEN